MVEARAASSGRSARIWNGAHSYPLPAADGVKPKRFAVIGGFAVTLRPGHRPTGVGFGGRRRVLKAPLPFGEDRANNGLEADRTKRYALVPAAQAYR